MVRLRLELSASLLWRNPLVLFLDTPIRKRRRGSFQWSIRAEPSRFSTSTHCSTRIVHVQPFHIRGVECGDCNGWWPLQILYPCSGGPVFFCILGTLGMIHFAIGFEMPYLEDSHVTMIPWRLKVAWRFDCEAWSKLVWFCRASIGEEWVHFIICIILRGNILGNMHAHICTYMYICIPVCMFE